MKTTKKVQETEKETPEAEQNPELNPEEETKEETKAEETEKETSEAGALDDVVDKALKLHPQYEKLYVNSKGFIFTEGTSKSMRGNAKLYENKYFKK